MCIRDRYTNLISFVQSRQHYDNINKPHIAKLFRNVMDDLSIRQVNGVDLVVLPARKMVIRELHSAHSGLTKSILTAQELYY